MDAVRFLNVDLDLQSREPLDPVVADLGEDVIVLYCGPRSGGYFASLELATGPSDADSTLHGLCRLIEQLGAEARAVWDRAQARSFNLGYESGGSPRLESTLRAETVQRVAALDAELVITIYPPPAADHPRR